MLNRINSAMGSNPYFGVVRVKGPNLREFAEGLKNKDPYKTLNISYQDDELLITSTYAEPQARKQTEKALAQKINHPPRSGLKATVE